MPNKTWIEEQEEAMRLFSGESQLSDAVRLLEHSITNRDISVKQAKLYTTARLFAAHTGFNIYSELADMCEHAQMNIDDTARHDYMKVAIEQFQGKLMSARAKDMKALL